MRIAKKKAAANAISIIATYPEKYQLLQKLSRLAREELRHFELVLKIMKSRDIVFINIASSGYAKNLQQLARTDLEGRMIDRLIVGSIIEARSCERFAALVPHVDEQLSNFYSSLLKSESRHFSDYLGFAQQYSDSDISSRVQLFSRTRGRLY